ncbi:hypothetical protein [Paracoccus yeei]|uniref:hypothetical protein n=1 Tax=Paracoccus yeei TaxID=147645 RepID=UPI00174CDD6E|nr:hypothetical protein [Paracoccus yeei]
MKRRAILKAIPAALVAGTVPAAALGQHGETPVAAAFRDWSRQRDLWRRVVQQGDEDDEVEYAKMVAMEEKMMALPSQTAKDMAIKMVVGHGFGEQSCLDYDGIVWAEARALVAT